ncbi:4Fe-4S binding protein [Myxococcota bacterium]|nr:4Fe-4S binding protein [Myxococcota bacterium]
MALCTWCGLCEEVCPEEAIVMSSVVEVAAFDRDSMVFRKSELMVPEELVIQRLEFVRRNRARQASAGR